LDRLVASVSAFSGLSYLKLSEVTGQSPIVGRSDLYYGGTTFENTQGLGVHMALSVLTSARSPEGRGESLRPDEDQWLAVPVTRLYDRGITVVTSSLLQPHIGAASFILHPQAAKSLGIQSGDLLKVNGLEAQAVLDETVPAGVMLVPRSMGTPIAGPMVVKISVA
jgi:NADH-quinone oxidoreductase subunit G